MGKDFEIEELKRGVEDAKRDKADLDALSQHATLKARTLLNSPIRQLKWLKSFCVMDVERLKEEKRLALRCELTYLASVGTRNFKKPPPILSAGLKLFHFSLCHPMRRLPDPDFLMRCQGNFQRTVLAFLDHQHVQFNLVGTPTLHVKRDAKGKPVLYVECETGEDGLEWWLASLLADQGSRFRRCLQCQKVSIVKRTDAKFCSGKCRALYNIRQQRKTPVDRYGKRGRPKKDEGR